MNKYARERKAFGQPLANYGQIQRYIAESYAEYQAGRAYTYNLAAGASLRRLLHSAACRCHCSSLRCASFSL
jgi:isovaleryl-CoA dehydrogenase